MNECDICGKPKKTTKLYDLFFSNNLTDSMFICNDCLNIQERCNELENIEMKEVKEFY